MPRLRTALQAATGKLISAIQKEYEPGLDSEQSAVWEHVMSQGHELLQGGDVAEIAELLNGQRVADFLGPIWVKRHPSVLPAIRAVELEVYGGRHA